MAEAQFASLDGAMGCHVDDHYYQPNPNAIARRSISIFSRKGTESPEPKPHFIAQEAMRVPKCMTERQKSWMRRRSTSGSCSPKSPSKTKGTVLKAVPPAQTIKMTALEEEMATSPNEEILTAVSDHSVSQLAWTAATYRTSPSQPTPTSHVSLWSRSTTSLAQRTKSRNAKDGHKRIGVWVDGIAHWEASGPGTDIMEDRAIEAETGFTPVRPILGDALTSVKRRPHLSVLIPGSDTSSHTMALSTIVQPKPCRPVVSVAPASLVSKYAWTPVITVEEPHVVSPLSSTEPVQRTPTSRKAQMPTLLKAADAPTVRPKRHSDGSSSSSSTEQDDDTSDYSKRSNHSSVTSIEATPPAATLETEVHGPISYIEVLGGAEEESHPDLNKPLPPCPARSPQRRPPMTPSSVAANATPLISRWSRSSRSTNSVPSSRSSLQPLRHMTSSRSLTALDRIDIEFMKTSPYGHELVDVDSPTLSQAEHELNVHLSTISDNDSPSKRLLEHGSHDVVLTKAPSVRRGDSVRSVMHPPERAPTLPKRSRKRDWKRSPAHITHIATPSLPVRRQSEVYHRIEQSDQDTLLTSPPVRRARSINATEMRQVYAAAQELRRYELEGSPVNELSSAPPKIVIDDGLIVVQGPVVVSPGTEADPMSPMALVSAETVLLHILESLNSLDDLFNTATINKGMYRVYKENGMELIRRVAYNQSPSAWELREWCPPNNGEANSSKESAQLEHTPKTYTTCHKRDVMVIDSLKGLMLRYCQTFIRRETVLAFSTPCHSHTQRFDDAFWRIWCFCTIFGNGKGREDDITGQVDWLRGGLLAGNQGAAATVNMNLEYDMGSVLLNAPEFFAKGNNHGLTAQQLYDMTEIWTCLSALLQGYQGRISQARKFGVFDACEVVEGHIEKEEQLLEEWTYYLLTLGPAVVLDMAMYANDKSPAGFALAKANGWTTWAPHMVTGSRNVFLKEPVSRLYEERVAAAALRLQNPREREKKEMSRKRVATLAAEIRLTRQSSTYKRSPYIDMHNERPMSTVTRRSSTASHRSSQRMSSSSYTYASGGPKSPPLTAPNFSGPRPVAPNSPGQPWSSRKISPIIEDRVETFNRLSLVNFAAGIAEDTSERAVATIVEMGFSAVQAREALKATDLGDGLRVDRAVELLLRART